MYFIRNAFTFEEQRKLIAKCLIDWQQPPNVSNLDVLYGPQKDLFQRWQKECNSVFDLYGSTILLGTNNLTPKRQAKNQQNPASLLYKLRWVTLGYHYDWYN